MTGRVPLQLRQVVKPRQGVGVGPQQRGGLRKLLLLQLRSLLKQWLPVNCAEEAVWMRSEAAVEALVMPQLAQRQVGKGAQQGAGMHLQEMPEMARAVSLPSACSGCHGVR